MTLTEARRNVRYLPIGKISESLMVLDNRITELERNLKTATNALKNVTTASNWDVIGTAKKALADMEREKS